jgi:allantoin racemase
MGFLEAHAEISSDVGVPVVNPVYAALRMAEALHGAGLRHSKRAYPLPPKLRSVTVG